jgi:hypothetical protein
MRIDAHHNLAVELKHKTQYAVGRRVLGPEIDGEIANGSVGHGDLMSVAGATPLTSLGSEDPSSTCAYL